MIARLFYFITLLIAIVGSGNAVKYIEIANHGCYSEMHSESTLHISKLIEEKKKSHESKSDFDTDSVTSFIETHHDNCSIDRLTSYYASRLG